MKISFANKFLILGLLLYLVAGIMVLSKMNYSFIVLVGAIILLAFGFFTHVKLKWTKLFKKRPEN